MPQSSCAFCHHNINIPAVQLQESSKCPLCKKDLLLYKCTSCMNVLAFDPAAIPKSCPRCHTIIRGISGSVADILPPPSQRHNSILIHNDNPPLTDNTTWGQLGVLVFRGAKVPYSELHDTGFQAVNDPRFPMRTIIRDKWKDRNVTTRMQTKSALAWSKSLSKAAEYAYGCISGGLGGVKPGNLYFAYVAQGVDVTAEIRKFELKHKLPRIDEGTQEEILTPTLPKSQILACWQLIKGKSGFGFLVPIKKEIFAGEFPNEVVQAYKLIDEKLALEKEFDYSILD